MLDSAGADYKHADEQSHRRAKVKEVTVLIHEAQHRLDSAVWLSPANWQPDLQGNPRAPG